MKLRHCTLIVSLFLLMLASICCSAAQAASISIVPSKTNVMPGEDFYFDVMVAGIPAEGLGTVQFRINLNSPGGTIAGVIDLGQAYTQEIAVSSPLLATTATATKSGIGDFFRSGVRNDSPIIYLDNEQLNNGTGLYTFAHTSGAVLPSGGGSVARFMVRVGANVNAYKLDIYLSDVMLLDGGPKYDVTVHTSSTSSTTVKLDNVPPAITVTGVTNDTTYTTDVTPVISISDTNPLSSTITLNGQTFVSGTKVTANGSYSLVVTAVDKAGNNSSKTVNFTISKALSITETQPASGADVPANSPIQVTFSDPLDSSAFTASNFILTSEWSGSAITAGFYNTMVVKGDGTVVAWGDGTGGQTTVPAGLAGVTSIAASLHTLALKSDGTVVAWGSNGYGQATIPEGLAGVTTIAAGCQHSVALKSDGTVVAWGYNGSGQTTVPEGLAEVKAIAAGCHHTVALKNDGTVVAWGINEHGQITVPSGLSEVTAVAAGSTYTLALKSDGTVASLYMVSCVGRITSWACCLQCLRWF